MAERGEIEDSFSNYTSFELPSNSLVVIKDDTIKWMQNTRLPSMLRFGECSSEKELTSGLIEPSHMEALKELLLDSVHKRTKSIPFC